MPALPIIILCVYLYAFLRCKKRLAESDKQLKPCISWARSNGLQLPKRPSLIAFYIVSINDSFYFFIRFPIWLLIIILDDHLKFTNDVRFYEREMKLLFDKWNLERNN